MNIMHDTNPPPEKLSRDVVLKKFQTALKGHGFSSLTFTSLGKRFWVNASWDGVPANASQKKPKIAAGHSQKCTSDRVWAWLLLPSMALRSGFQGL